MERLRDDLEKLADKELKEAIKGWGLNHSNHESVAVLREEIEEARDEMDNLEWHLSNVWDCIKENEKQEEIQKLYADAYDDAIRLAGEAIQAAAMARKAILSLPEVIDNEK